MLSMLYNLFSFPPTRFIFLGRKDGGNGRFLMFNCFMNPSRYVHWKSIQTCIFQKSINQNDVIQVKYNYHYFVWWGTSVFYLPLIHDCQSKPIKSNLKSKCPAMLKQSFVLLSLKVPKPAIYLNHDLSTIVN